MTFPAKINQLIKTEHEDFPPTFVRTHSGSIILVVSDKISLTIINF
jgi:hypothetical protein